MNRKLKADLALMFCSLIWGVTFVVVKDALDYTSVFVFLAIRFTLAAILMAALRPGVLKRIDREEIFAGMRLAFLCSWAMDSRRRACGTRLHPTRDL
jgi:drug/metabolite transporter (DMT)-like permease